MKDSRHLLFFSLLAGTLLWAWAGQAFCQGIIIDHTCTELDQIPEPWINQVKTASKIHYAHTSHGEQITVGLEELASADPRYSFYPDYCNMPQTDQYLSLMDGQSLTTYCETYVTPDLYWEGTYALDITRSVLSGFDVNASGWAWCTQLDYYSAGEVQSYLDAMSQLESEYPNIRFIYMTGNAQSAEPNRYARNNQIRDYCRANNKVLFDFGDLDSWYNGRQYVESGIPMEHPQYYGDGAGHTNYANRQNKARAFWWLLARIAGWDGTTTPPASLSFITITSPNGGETWLRGTQQTIAWTHDGDPEQTVQIYLTNDTWRVHSLARSTSIGPNGMGSFMLTIPEWLAPGEHYRIAVESLDDPTIKDVSDGYFNVPRRSW